MSRRWNGFVFLVLGALVAVGSPIVPSESSCASDSLKTLTPAEADFRANDRDWCNVTDFWTGEVLGLDTLTSAENSDEQIKRIELSIESADTDNR